jgi:hypothetical protein
MPKTRSQRTAYCLERARAYGEKARAAPDLSDQKSFSELEARWLSLARGRRVSRRLIGEIDDREFHDGLARSFLHRAGAEFGDSGVIACMLRAYAEIMKAVSLTAARLVFDLARQGERDPYRLCNAVLMLLNAKEQKRSQTSTEISTNQPSQLALGFDVLASSQIVPKGRGASSV